MFQAYHSLAKYADAQYQSLRDYVKSPMFQTKQAVINRNKVRKYIEIIYRTELTLKHLIHSSNYFVKKLCREQVKYLASINAKLNFIGFS